MRQVADSETIARTEVRSVGEAHVGEAVTANTFGSFEAELEQYRMAIVEMDKAVEMIQERRDEIMRRISSWSESAGSSRPVT